MDTQLVEKIVHEVKSQGVFDEFRKDSMADVDTKPAYQNLRQRVENTVKKFLAEQKWTLDTNKNQLREKLRKHITESGFLDVGVERIVDQVVNPKIGSVFQPRIEEIAYKYLGLQPPSNQFQPPPPPLMHPLPPLPLNAPPLKVETCSLLPTDLEQVSPDSDIATVKSEENDDKTAIDMDTIEKIIEDEDESPPFEPLVKNEIVEDNNYLKVEHQMELNIKEECDISLIEKATNFEECNDAAIKTEIIQTNNDSLQESRFATESIEVDKEASQSVDARISQDSQLSSVSSDSCLSANGKEDSARSSQEAVAANISEEAQMPKFNDNSCEPNATNGGGYEMVSIKPELHFDIKKDEIKFEGTERKTGLGENESTAAKSEEEKCNMSVEKVRVHENENDSFKFSCNKPSIEIKQEECERTPNAQELSFDSSIEDSSSMPVIETPKQSVYNRGKDEAPQIQTPKLTTPILVPSLPTSTPTQSLVTSLKPDKEIPSRYYYSSSSKHKKHSKERRSNEREKEKDSRERHRSGKEIKDSSKYHSTSGPKIGSSKHSSSSSSSKYSSSRNKTTEKDVDKSSYSLHSALKHTKHSHSHSSSSSNEIQESKKSKRDSERRHHSSSSSSSKRIGKKDDHNEAKHKTPRRKSTDSNDDGDKSIGGGKYGSQCKSWYSLSGSKSSKSSGNENNKVSTYKTNDGQKDKLEMKEFQPNTSGKYQHINNVVILNDILENPQIQCIQLNNKGHLLEMPVQQQRSSTDNETNKHSTEYNNNNIEFLLSKENPEIEEKVTFTDLFYFEEIQLDITDRLQKLNDTMDLCRSAVNSLRFDFLSDEGIELSNEEDANSDNNKMNLLTESLKRRVAFNYEEFEATPRKRCVSNESEGRHSKTSPAPSDTSSVNSKENEEIYKNTYHAKTAILDRHKADQKLTQQQRYSSEELYKPRPILGQRSRRRGMDSLA